MEKKKTNKKKKQQFGFRVAYMAYKGFTQTLGFYFFMNWLELANGELNAMARD